MNQRFLFDRQIEFDRVQQQIIGKRTKLRNSRDHGLPAGLIDIPRVNAAGVNFRHGPCQRVLANSLGQFARAVPASIFWNRPGQRFAACGLRITAPATTGPNSEPRPASSSPAMRCHPCCRASRSYRARAEAVPSPRILTHGSRRKFPQSVRIVRNLKHRRVEHKRKKKPAPDIPERAKMKKSSTLLIRRS